MLTLRGLELDKIILDELNKKTLYDNTRRELVQRFQQELASYPQDGWTTADAERFHKRIVALEEGTADTLGAPNGTWQGIFYTACHKFSVVLRATCKRNDDGESGRIVLSCGGGVISYKDKDSLKDKRPDVELREDGELVDDFILPACLISKRQIKTNGFRYEIQAESGMLLFIIWCLCVVVFVSLVLYACFVSGVAQDNKYPIRIHCYNRAFCSVPQTPKVPQ